MSVPQVVIAVPTFHRIEMLAALLPLLRDQITDLKGATGLDARVLVVDNDPDASAEQTVEAAGADYALEPARGLAAVRNRALDESAAAGAIVFIDDDEVPADGWLTALVRRWQLTGAAAVSGRVHSRLPDGVDPWIAAGGFFTRVRFADGALQPVAATNNLLLDLGFATGAGLRFDEAFGLSGGEDIHFTKRLVLAGGSIVSAPDALVFDPVSPDRATRRWVLTRAYRVGLSAVRTELAVRTGLIARSATRVRAIVGGAARVVVGGARWAVGTILRSAPHSARGARAVARGGGMVLGAFGVDYAEYARRG